MTGDPHPIPAGEVPAEILEFFRDMGDELGAVLLAVVKIRVSVRPEEEEESLDCGCNDPGQAAVNMIAVMERGEEQQVAQKYLCQFHAGAGEAELRSIVEPAGWTVTEIEHHQIGRS
jgi:hypothetical protein